LDKTNAAGNINGDFVAQDLATNQPPTQLDPEWFNDVQAELINIINAGGIIPQKGVQSQVLDALANLAPGNISRAIQFALLHVAPIGGDEIPLRDSITGIIKKINYKSIQRVPFFVEEMGIVGTADDTAIFQAAYNQAKALNRPLQLPSRAAGFNVTSLEFIGNIPVFGAGPRNTIFNALADGVTVVKQSDRIGNNGNRGWKVPIKDFAINLSNRINTIGLHTEKQVSSVLERLNIYGNDWPASTATSGNTGWLSVGDQYSSCNDIYIERTQVGFRMQDGGVGVGGGINMHYNGLHVSNTQFGAVITNTGTYPFGINRFTNLRIQVTSHCALYLDNVYNMHFSGLPPESCSGSGTLVYDGFTIKAGHIHANNSQAAFADYVHVSNDALMVITADNYSKLVFSNSGGAAIRTVADNSSSILWDGTWGNGSVFSNTEINLQSMGLVQTVCATQTAKEEVDATFPNLVPLPLVSTVTAITATSQVVDGDPDMVAVRSVQFSAVAGNTLGLNQVVFIIGAAPFSAGDTVVSSFLVKATTDTKLGFVLSQSVVTTPPLEFKAGVWTRVFLSNKITSTRDNYVIGYAVDTDAPLVKFTHFVTAVNLNNQHYSRLSNKHIFNPKDAKGVVYRLAAAPTTGTWAVGQEVWHSAPAAGGVPGWVCTTAGTPGTWKAMASLAI
jgi:hypothetical protein